MSVSRNIASNPLTFEKPNGVASGMQGTLHLPAHLPVKLVWRDRMRKWWSAVVAKGQGKFSIREGVAYAFLAAALAFGVQSWWRGQDQHDEIIRLQTKLEMTAQENIKQDDQISQARATAQIADRNAARLEGKFDQFSQIYTVANPRQP